MRDAAARDARAGSVPRARGRPAGLFSTAALLALVPSVASCSWTHDTRYAPDGGAGIEEIAAVVTPGTAGGLALVVVREMVQVPPSGDLAVQEAEVASVVPWDPGEKAMALPVGLGFLALTPFALAYGIAVTPFGETIGDKDLPALFAPLLTLGTAGACLAQFAWFFQPLPGLAISPVDPDRLRLERTGASRTVPRTGLPAGACSIPKPALGVRLRGGSGEVLSTGTTDREGRVLLAVPAGSVEPGRAVWLDIDRPDAPCTLRLEVAPLGAEFTAFPPVLPASPSR